MRYALRRYGAPQADRETIAHAILASNANVLDAQEAAGTIIHVRDDPDPKGLFCIY